jgi:hypothetical protein
MTVMDVRHFLRRVVRLLRLHLPSAIQMQPYGGDQ